MKTSLGGDSAVRHCLSRERRANSIHWTWRRLHRSLVFFHTLAAEKHQGTWLRQDQSLIFLGPVCELWERFLPFPSWVAKWKDLTSGWLSCLSACRKQWVEVKMELTHKMKDLELIVKNDGTWTRHLSLGSSCSWSHRASRWAGEVAHKSFD